MEIKLSKREFKKNRNENVLETSINIYMIDQHVNLIAFRFIYPRENQIKRNIDHLCEFNKIL